MWTIPPADQRYWHEETVRIFAQRSDRVARQHNPAARTEVEKSSGMWWHPSSLSQEARNTVGRARSPRPSPWGPGLSPMVVSPSTRTAANTASNPSTPWAFRVLREASSSSGSRACVVFRAGSREFWVVSAGRVGMEEATPLVVHRPPPPLLTSTTTMLSTKLRPQKMEWDETIQVFPLKQTSSATVCRRSLDLKLFLVWRCSWGWGDLQVLSAHCCCARRRLQRCVQQVLVKSVHKVRHQDAHHKSRDKAHEPQADRHFLQSFLHNACVLLYFKRRAS